MSTANRALNADLNESITGQALAMKNTFSSFMPKKSKPEQATITRYMTFRPPTKSVEKSPSTSKTYLDSKSKPTPSFPSEGRCEEKIPPLVDLTAMDDDDDFESDGYREVSSFVGCSPLKKKKEKKRISKLSRSSFTQKEAITSDYFSNASTSKEVASQNETSSVQATKLTPAATLRKVTDKMCSTESTVPETDSESDDSLDHIDLTQLDDRLSAANSKPTETQLLCAGKEYAREHSPPPDDVFRDLLKEGDGYVEHEHEEENEEEDIIPKTQLAPKQLKREQSNDDFYRDILTKDFTVKVKTGVDSLPNERGSITEGRESRDNVVKVYLTFSSCQGILPGGRRFFIGEVPSAFCYVVSFIERKWLLRPQRALARDPREAEAPGRPRRHHPQKGRNEEAGQVHQASGEGRAASGGASLLSEAS